jgi:hypothetical protein
LCVRKIIEVKPVFFARIPWRKCCDSRWIAFLQHDRKRPVHNDLQSRWFRRVWVVVCIMVSARGQDTNRQDEHGFQHARFHNLSNSLPN